MQRIRRGFTLIEVSIFLAITGLLFAMVVIGVQNSISQQRFNDVVQNYVEFLRSIYAGVTNVQSSG
ncbi:MAG: type II secretion system protein, partial [Bacillus sp. (in: Bacteria)]|nr:type II secretion system protein [Bacillus sp. (in: firmicutes)]